MNASTFANSREAGVAVVWIVACLFLAAVTAVVLIQDYRAHLRRAARVRDARAQRDARVRTFPAGATLRVLRPGSGPGMGGDRIPAAARARVSGIDELQVEDFSLWAERTR